MTSSHNLL